MSYNPSYRDHQTLLQEVANKELILIKEEKHLNRVTSKMFSRVTEDEKEVSRFVKLHL
jgi:nucleolar protein 53